MLKTPVPVPILGLSGYRGDLVPALQELPPPALSMSSAANGPCSISCARFIVSMTSPESRLTPIT